MIVMNKEDLPPQIIPPGKESIVENCTLKLHEALTIASVDSEPKNGFIRQKETKSRDIIVCHESHSSQNSDKVEAAPAPTEHSDDRTNSSASDSVVKHSSFDSGSQEVESSAKLEEHCSLISECKAKDMSESEEESLAKNTTSSRVKGEEIEYVGYKSELQMPDIMRLIQKDLSEPYSIYTYRYFIHNWPNLCFLAMSGNECVGAIVCKLDYHKKISKRGYIAMLAVDQNFRKRMIGSTLVKKAIDAMITDDADEVVLETEITNKPALQLYENLGFVRDKRLFRYYLNGVDALRLKLWLR